MTTERYAFRMQLHPAAMTKSGLNSLIFCMRRAFLIIQYGWMRIRIFCLVC